MPVVNVTSFPSPTPEQLHAILAILVPVVDQYIAQHGTRWVKLGWSIVRTFIVNAEPQALATAYASLPHDSQIA